MATQQQMEDWERRGVIPSSEMFSSTEEFVEAWRRYSARRKRQEHEELQRLAALKEPPRVGGNDTSRREWQMPIATCNECHYGADRLFPLGFKRLCEPCRARHLVGPCHDCGARPNEETVANLWDNRDGQWRCAACVAKRDEAVRAAADRFRLMRPDDPDQVSRAAVDEVFRKGPAVPHPSVVERAKALFT